MRGIIRLTLEYGIELREVAQKSNSCVAALAVVCFPVRFLKPIVSNVTNKENLWPNHYIISCQLSLVNSFYFVTIVRENSKRGF